MLNFLISWVVNLLLRGLYPFCLEFHLISTSPRPRSVYDGVILTISWAMSPNLKCPYKLYIIRLRSRVDHFRILSFILDIFCALIYTIIVNFFFLILLFLNVKLNFFFWLGVFFSRFWGWGWHWGWGWGWLSLFIFRSLSLQFFLDFSRKYFKIINHQDHQNNSIYTSQLIKGIPVSG